MQQQTRSTVQVFTPEHQSFLPLCPEQGAGVTMDLAEKITKRIFTVNLEHLTHDDVGDNRKREVIEWVVDPLFREDEELYDFTFAGYCRGLGVEVFGMISSLVTMKRGLVDRLLGPGAARKLAGLAEDRRPVTDYAKELMSSEVKYRMGVQQ